MLPACGGETFVFRSGVPAGFDNIGSASSVVPVFVPGGTVCDVTVAFYANLKRPAGSTGFSVQAQSPRSLHPLLDTPQLAAERLGDSCSAPISFNDSAAGVFTGLPVAPGAPTDTFRSGMGSVFGVLKGLPAAAVNGGWLLTVRAPAGTSGRLECWEVTVRTN